MSKSITSWRACIFSAAILASFAGSCVDTTPIVVADNSPWLFPTDAGADTGESACLRCQRAPNVPGPGCADELAACYSHSACARTADCTIASGCYNLGTSADWQSCALPCGTREKIGEDPAALGAAYTIYNCLQRTCNEPCNPGARD